MRTPRALLARVLAAAALGGSLLGLLAPAATSAHPLGNFTINHYAGLRVSPSAIDLDVVIDYAEIPAFQERRLLDTDGDGDVSTAEAAAARGDRCSTLAESLALTAGGHPVTLTTVAAGLSFPPGAGGLATMRLVCEYRAALPDGLAAGTPISFVDSAYAERIGWREIVVRGDDASIGPLAGSPAPPGEETSARLTAYPADLLAQPLAVGAASFTATPGGPSLSPFVAPDATPLDGAQVPAAPDDPLGAVPGGVGAEIPDIFRTVDLSPLIALASILVAAALGAGHALTPGHGKTLMAAYLVGTRGTAVQAIGLGLSVAVSHTLGILVLAILVTGAESVLPPDLVVRTVPLVAALGFVAIGGWMATTEVRRRLAARAHAHALAYGLEHAHAVSAELPHEHEHEHERLPEHEHEHEHGGVRHSHAPVAGRPITWRSLFALGLAGGIIPSTNALIILLVALVTGRAAFGVVLVFAFGLGMAAVLGGIGVALVVVRGRIERLPSSHGLNRLATHAPLVASVLVLGIGLWLTAQAASSLPTL